MANAGTWVNADGLVVKFADYHKNSENFINIPRGVRTSGAIKEVWLDYDLSKLASGDVSYTTDLTNNGVKDGFNTGDCYLPANASVLRATLIVTEAAAGGTSIKLGTFGLTGSAIDDDFIITATEGVKANIDTVGARVYGNGAGVATTAETAGVGTADAYLAMTIAGTFTAGKGRIVIEYMDPLVDA
jgi:hypothetical protein